MPLDGSLALPLCQVPAKMQFGFPLKYFSNFTSLSLQCIQLLRNCSPERRLLVFILICLLFFFPNFLFLFQSLQQFSFLTTEDIYLCVIFFLPASWMSNLPMVKKTHFNILIYISCFLVISNDAFYFIPFLSPNPAHLNNFLSALWWEGFFFFPIE